MAECPDGRTNRGTRSQFRIGLPGLGLCKGFYPVSLGKIMDADQSSQISSSSSRDLISPCKGTHTLTVREYEQTIDELKKENFNLKLKLYLCDEIHLKTCKDKESITPNDEMLQVIVHLSSESDSLRTELKNKEKLLQDTLEQVEKFESDFKELEKRNADLQSELTSFSELPSKEDIFSLLQEKENFINHIESLESLIKEKEDEIDTLNQKIEILAGENKHLEEKIKKRSIAIQSFVYKSYKEKEMLPDEIRNIAISATQAAKKKNKDDLVVAVKTFTSALTKIMSTSEISQSEEKENIKSSRAKCLKEEALEKSTDSFHSSQTELSPHIAPIQDLNVLSERNISDTKETRSVESFIHHQYIRGKMVHQNAVNISDKDVLNFCDISPSTEENLISFSERPSLQTCTVSEHDLIDIESVSSSPALYKLIPEKDISESNELVNILKENEQLKQDLEEKLAVINNLNAAYDELKKVKILQESGSDAFKASQCCASTQTKITGSNLLDEYEVIKLQKDAKLSDNVEELREDILLLLLAIEEKNKELSDLKLSQSAVQEDLEKALNMTNAFDKDFYLHERNELHEKLTLSCSINEDLMRHLKNLEKFMEDLLQHKFDSSLENITDKSDFISSISRCLNESLKLSRTLSDQLSICEGSKLFEECESFAYKSGIYSEEKDLPYPEMDKHSMPERQSSYFGSRMFEEYISNARKNNLRVGKESDSSQLCWRCWQQLNPSLKQLELSQLIQSNSIPKPIGYQSSDSDIWSEPDRNVSMQRIGISLQNSPVSSKSPRKLRHKDKRMSSRISSKEDTSSSESQQACKKRHGSASRRLFTKENAKIEDFALDKFYILVAEKYSKLKSLLNDLGNIKNGTLSDVGWMRLNRLVLSAGETLQKLHFVKENAKTPLVCERCIMLELFSNLTASYVESDFFIDGTSSEQEILHEFSRELYLLKEACKEPFSILYGSNNKKSIASQSDTLSENEQIKEFETIIDDLNARNKELSKDLEKVKELLSKNGKELVSIKTENSHLLSEVDNLKIDLLDMKYREKELVLQNEKLNKDFTSLSKNNTELKNILWDLEQKRKESNIELDQLKTELEKQRSDLIHMNEKCLEYEKQLNEQIHIRENSENKLKILETESVREKNCYLLKIDNLTELNDHYMQELKTVDERRLTLEKENAVINDRLQSKTNELLSLKETIEKLKSIKETQDDLENGLISAVVLESVKTENSKLVDQIIHLKSELINIKSREKELLLENKKLCENLDDMSKKYSEINHSLIDTKQKMEEYCSTADQLRVDLQKNRLDFEHMNKKCQIYEKQLNEQIQMKEKYENQLKTLQIDSFKEKEYYLNQLDALNVEKIHYEEELKNIREKMHVLEKDNATLNSSLRSKNEELLSLEKTTEFLKNTRETLISDHETAKRLLSKGKESSECMEMENFKLLNHIKQLEEKIFHMKDTEKELCLQNENLAKEFNIELNRLAEELQEKKSDLIHMNEKCAKYEKQLNEQVHMRQNTESKLKNLEMELLGEKNYYLGKINDLNAEKNHYVQELKAVQEKRLALEKENAIINDRLQSKDNELLSSKEIIEKLQNIKETQNDIENESVSKEKVIVESMKVENRRLSNEVDHLKEELFNRKYKETENKKELDHISKKNSDLNNVVKDLEQKYKEAISSADHLKAELQKNSSDLVYMNKTCLEYEKQLNEQMQKKEKLEHHLKTLELNSLSEKENYLHQLDALNAEKNHYEQKMKIIEAENFRLSNQINQMNEELLYLKNKEKEFCLTNEKLVGELNEVSKNNFKLNNRLKALEQKIRDSNVELDNLTTELQKNASDVINLSEKCLAYEKQLNEQTQLKEKFANELKTQEANLMKEKRYYLGQINDLNVKKDHYLRELESVQEKKHILESEIGVVNDKLQSKNNELSSLQKKVEELQKAKETVDSNYVELQSELANSQECLTNLQEKCKKCEAVIQKFKQNEFAYNQQLKQLEAKSTTEKDKLLNEISMLTKEKEDILQKLKDEKERYKKLKDENVELSDNCSKSTQQVSTLKHRNEFFENALLSSNKECESLNKDLKCLRNTLQNLESKCLMYEKQLVATAGMKDNLTECLININNEFYVQRQKLNEICKTYGNDDSVVWDETSFNKFMPVIDEDNVSKLCENTVSETKKLSQSVDILLSILKSYHLKSVETKTSEEKKKAKTQSLKKQMELHKIEVENLCLQNDRLQNTINELQKDISEKEKSVQCNAYEVKTLKEKFQNSQKEIDRQSQLVQRKDDEITRLQERIFNLQTYVNNIMTGKMNMLEKSTDMTEKLENLFSSNNQLPSKVVSVDTKMCQTDECEGITQSIDDSFASISSLESGKCHYCEKYWKKCYSLQTKLALCRKHIEKLEKDKSDLKESLLQQLQNKKDSLNKNDTSISKSVELESKLEKKKLFICELKNELLKTCNELIDKEKEIDNLKQRLAECEVKFEHEVLDASKNHSTVTSNSVDANVKTLKNYKWKLIQTIFDIQRKFYEKKGIHLNYFDRFKEHVNNLYSLQLIPPLSKSESMPLLRSFAFKEQHKQGNERVKKLADLELDIECLENLKIFLNRFLVPCVFQTSEASDKQTQIRQTVVSSDRLSLPISTEKATFESQKESRHEITDILNLSFPEAFILTDNERTLNIDVIAPNISQHLDYIKKFVDAVTKRNLSETVALSDEDSVDKAEVKSVLLKIFQEISVLHEETDKLFNFNECLKKFDCVTSFEDPLRITKIDASDRESIMSEETIAVSRTESPLSFEDICPIKLPHPETLQLKDQTLKPASIGNRVTVIEPYSTKMTIVDGSCDSVCQRSHYSSPDLGIESDPNHDSSAPEHKDDGATKYPKFPFKLQQPKTTFTSIECAGRWPESKFGETCFAVGNLPHFELLKQEIKESLVAIKSILSRTGDGLHHIAKYTSPRKTLEYNTLKSIKDTCVHMEVCLKEANNLVGKFWTAPCPTENEWKMLKEENHTLAENLACLRTLVEKQENDFRTAMGKLERTQAVKDNIEKKISKKLVKTKKLIRQAELKLLETRCQNFPPVPKYPTEQTQ